MNVMRPITGSMDPPPTWSIIAWTEAAQNMAALGGIAAIQDDIVPISKDGDYFEALKDLWIFGIYVMGDSLDIVQSNLTLSSGEGRTLDMRGCAIETDHDVLAGFLDLRFSPIFWPKGETVIANFKEDKSTNVEASVLAWITDHPYRLDWTDRIEGYKELLFLTLTGASTTGGKWFDSTKTMNDNQDSRVLAADGIYEVIGTLDQIGGSGVKAARLVFPEGRHCPGIKVMEDNVDTPIPPWQHEWPRPRPTFEGDTPPKMYTLDTDGSLTPIVTWKIGRIG